MKKIIWLVLCIAPYLHWLMWIGAFSSESTSWQEKDIYMWISLSALGFPCSVVWFYLAALFQLALAQIGIEFTNLYVTNTLIWIGAVVVGYLQWFILVPLLRKKWKESRLGTGGY